MYLTYFDKRFQAKIIKFIDAILGQILSFIDYIYYLVFRKTLQKWTTFQRLTTLITNGLFQNLLLASK